MITINKKKKGFEKQLDDERIKLIGDHLTKERATQSSRIEDAAAHVHDLRTAAEKFHPALGMPVASMSQTDFIRLYAKYGKEMFEDDFLKFFQREYPELTPNKV